MFGCSGRAQLVALLLWQAACSPPPEPIRIGLLVWPPYEFFRLADEAGYYGDVQVDFVDYRSPAEALRAYENGSIDGVAMTVDFLIQVCDTSPGSRAILVVDSSAGGDCVVAHSGIESLADLRGKTIGLEMSTLGSIMLTRALEAAELEPADVTLKFVDTAEHESAFRSGQVDAIVTYEPTRTRLLGEGGNVLFDSSAIPMDIVDVLFVKDELIAARPDDLRVIVQGFLQAADRYRGDPATVAAKCAAREGLTSAEFEAALRLVDVPDRERNERLLGNGDDALLYQTVDRLHALLLDKKKISAEAPRRGLLDARFVARRDG
ncbi:MAG: ABC transporter substrate-binding protein [Planctomycetes bacterium]|nr:ABC transporter substrate-binding protein [Planctomycetota bacterium]